MKYFNLFLLGMTIFLFSNCKSFEIAKHYSNEEIESKLPKMTVVYVDSKTGIARESKAGLGSQSLTMEIVNHEMTMNICNDIVSNYSFRVTITDTEHQKNVVGTLFNTLTLGVGALLGVPWRTDKYEAIMLCHVLDKNLNPVSAYRHTGYGKAHVASYYGYKLFDIEDEAKARAIKNAFSKIKNDIKNDSSLLNTLK